MFPDQLTDDHRRALEGLCAPWAERAAAPDRARAERGVAGLYRSLGLEPPAVVWFDSPLAGALAARTLASVVGPAVPERVPMSGPQPQRGAGYVYDLALAYGEHVSHALVAEAADTVNRLVARPAWASFWVFDQAVAQAVHPADPEFLAAVRSDVRARLDREPAPLIPAERREAARSVLGDAAAGRPPREEEQWRPVREAARHPYEPGLLVLEAFLRDATGTTVTAALDDLLSIAPAVGYWWAFRGIAVLTAPPVEVHLSADGRPHRADGPAVRFGDGFAVHLWRGHLVPPDLVDPGWTAADIAGATDDELDRRATAALGPRRYGHDVTDLRRCAVERLGWGRFATEAGLVPVAGPEPDPARPDSSLTLYDVPEAVFGLPSRVVVRHGGSGAGTGLLVPTDSVDPVSAAAWLGGATSGSTPATDSAPVPDPGSDLLRRLREDPALAAELPAFDFDLGDHEHVEEVRLVGGARLEAVGSHGTGGTYFLCGDGPRRPLLFADSEGGARVLGRDLVEALELLAYEHAEEAADDEDEERAESVAEAVAALGLRPPRTRREYDARLRAAGTMAVALTLVMVEEGNAYEYRRT